MDYPIRLYSILYPQSALVASQLTPEQFSKHYISGNARHADGKMMFVEMDPTFRNPYFRIDEKIEQVSAHDDGRPKSTKFICSYRVVEHLDLNSIQRLYLTTAEGHCLSIEPAEHVESPDEKNKLRVYAEIAPLRVLALARHSFEAFGAYITDPGNAKGAPALFYTQLELEVDEFLDELDHNPMMISPIPGVHPSKLRDSIAELRQKLSKPLKGISLHSSFEKFSYRMIQSGFMFARGDENLFFPMPNLHDIENHHYKFWRHM